MFTLRFHENNFREIEDQKNGFVDIERIKNIKNKMQLIKKNLDPLANDQSGISPEEAQQEKKAEKSSGQKASKEEDIVLKMRPEPLLSSTRKSPLSKSFVNMDDEESEEASKILEHTKKLNQNVINKLVEKEIGKEDLRDRFELMKKNIRTERDRYVIQSNKLVNLGKFNQSFDKRSVEEKQQIYLKEPPSENFFSFTSIVDRVNSLRKGKSMIKNAIEKVKTKRHREQDMRADPVQRATSAAPTSTNKEEKSPSEQSKYNFKKMNQKRFGVESVKEDVFLPNKIDSIASMEVQKMGTFKPNFTPTERKVFTFENFSSLMEEDYIENCSVVDPDFSLDKNSEYKISFYLELSPLSRELMSLRSEHKKYMEKVAFDLLIEKDLQFLENKITFENMMNLVGGRISEDILHKILSGASLLEFFEEESREEAVSIQLSDSSSQKDDSFAANVGAVITSDFLERPGTNLNNLASLFQKEVIETKSFANQGESRDESQGKLNSSFRTMGKNWESNGSSANNANAKKSPIKFQEAVNRSIQADLRSETSRDDASSNATVEDKPADDLERRSSRQSVDQLLAEIADINETKRMTMNREDHQVAMSWREELNKRLENSLSNLLDLILDKEDEINVPDKNDPKFKRDRQERIKDSLRIIIRDIDKLHRKYIDGHLKTKLVFQFLKEFRQIQEEKKEMRKNALSLEESYNDAEPDSDSKRNNGRELPNLSPAKHEYKPSKDLIIGKQLIENENLGKDIKFMNRGWGVKGDLAKTKVSQPAGKTTSKSPFRKEENNPQIQAQQRPNNNFLKPEQQRDILMKNQKRKVSAMVVKDPISGGSNQNGKTLKKKASNISNLTGSAWIGGSNIDFSEFE